MKRRKFILGLVGITAAGWSASQIAARSKTNDVSSINNIKGFGELAKVTRNGTALGTTISITAFYNNVAGANRAIDAAFAAIDQVEDIMSLYRPESQLCQLNRTAHLENPHPDLVRVLETALQLSQQSNGAFDVTVQPLWELHQTASLTGKQPTQSNIDAALQKIGWQQIELSESSIRLSKPGSAITLNGIAQGFAADAARKALVDNGIKHALIDTGEIGTIGSHAQKPDWTIGIKHPRQNDEFIDLAALNGRCLATSGDYETHFTPDFQSHHILDARTGRSPLELSSVSVIAPTAMEADALSTASLLMGVEKAKKLIEGIPNADALFVTKSGRKVSTPDFPFAT